MGQWRVIGSFYDDSIVIGRRMSIRYADWLEELCMKNERLAISQSRFLV